MKPEPTRLIDLSDWPNLEELYAQAGAELEAHDWRGPEGEIAQTGEEDPLALVDDPDLKEVIAAKMSMRRSHSAPNSYAPDEVEQEFAEALDHLTELAQSESQPMGESSIPALSGLIKSTQTFLHARQFERGDSDRRIQQLSMLGRFRLLVDELRRA